MPEFSKFSERSLSRSDVGFSDLEVERHLLIALQKGTGRTDLRSFVLDAALPPAQIERVLEKMLRTYRLDIEAAEDGNWLLTYDPASLSRRGVGEDLSALETRRRWQRVLAYIATIPLFVFWANFFLPLYGIYYGFRALVRVPKLRQYRADILAQGRAPGLLNLWAEWMRDDEAPTGYSSVLSPEYRTDRRLELEKFRSWLIGDRSNLQGEFEQEQDLLVWLADQDGITTRAELTMYMAWTGEELERELTRLLSRFHGHVHVDDDGVEILVFEDLRHLQLVHDDDLPYAWLAPERDRKFARVAKRVGSLHLGVGLVIPLLLIVIMSFTDADLPLLFFSSFVSTIIAIFLLIILRLGWIKRLKFMNARRIERNLKRAFLQPMVESGLTNQWVDEAFLFEHAEDYYDHRAVWPNNFEHVSYPRSAEEWRRGYIQWEFVTVDNEGNESDVPAPMSEERDRIYAQLIQDLQPVEEYEAIYDEEAGETRTRRWLHFPQFERELRAADAYRRKTHRWENLQLHADFERFEQDVARRPLQAPAVDPVAVALNQALEEAPALFDEEGVGMTRSAQAVASGV